MPAALAGRRLDELDPWLGGAYAFNIGSPASEITGGPLISRFDKRFVDGTMRQSR